MKKSDSCKEAGITFFYNRGSFSFPFVQEIQNLFYILENRIEFVVKYKRKILA